MELPATYVKTPYASVADMVQPIASPSMPSVRFIALLDPASTKNRKITMNHSGMQAIIGYFIKGIHNSRIIWE